MNNKKKYRIEVPIDWVSGYLRYGHFEGTVELTDEEIEKIKNNIIDREFICDNLELVIDDYEINDYGNLGKPVIEEIDNVY